MALSVHAMSASSCASEMKNLLSVLRKPLTYASVI
jgi:hypothetical protein